MTEPSLASIVESLIFVADSPLSLDRLCTLLEEFERTEIRAAVVELQEYHGQVDRGVELVEVAGGYQFRTRLHLSEYVRRLNRAKPAKFSQSALETLAIIAYRQPVTRAEVEYLRGVDSGGVLKTLLDKKLIRILGKKDIPGKPLIYGTTKDFLELFNLRDLKGLPALKEIRDLTETARYEQQEELPLEPTPAVEAEPDGTPEP